MRVLVCGGREFSDATLLNSTLDRLHAERRFTVLIEGGARGADTMAGEWADRCGIDRMTYRAEWAKFGRASGPSRNERMLADGKPALVLAFPGGTGTAHMMRIARAARVEVIEVSPAS